MQLPWSMIYKSYRFEKVPPVLEKNGRAGARLTTVIHKRIIFTWCNETFQIKAYTKYNTAFKCWWWKKLSRICTHLLKWWFDKSSTWKCYLKKKKWMKHHRTAAFTRFYVMLWPNFWYLLYESCHINIGWIDLAEWWQHV